ncbi:MAG: transketolase [Candidatus Sungbacteria bacterium RIFCSPLOWO2_01_FULL_59_16]|uniref:Transketolase n=1 Tax=Candidatus Sungbacteria bacterium RIFCSPLOWO2_01_FULL_59_16 TaxID=1802280 RepID=A0A1G2L9T1_9BACT|nr:MAG: transketolase [Candidatus Sungbacteria bacterium RIFCSPLOWO2_01_FULL_59_16]
MKSLTLLEKQAANIRRRILVAAHRARSAHIGSALSAVDILAYLYAGALRFRAREPNWPNRDRFILSKGHGALALYATLVEHRFFRGTLLAQYFANGSKLAGHPVWASAPGIEATTGSLGHGLSLGLGQALAAKYDKRSYRVFVMLSDGECDEGSIWEAAMAASHWKLDNLIAIIDYNKIQSFGTVKEVMNLEPFREKWRSFGWSTQEVNGHDFQNLALGFKKIPRVRNKPTVIIAHTVKGKGISFMENTLTWHYKNLTDELLAQALQELVTA